MIKRLMLYLFTGALLLAGASIFYEFLFPAKSADTSGLSERRASVCRFVSALGRLEPDGEIITVSTAGGVAGRRVSRLLVKEGDSISKGEVLAVLASHDRFAALLELAKMRKAAYEARLEQVKAGAKQSRVNAQRAVVARHEAELVNASREHARYRNLYDEGAISASMYELKALEKEAAQRRLAEAKSRLQALTETRPEDIRKARADIETAAAEVKKAQAELKLCYVVAPQDGRIIKIHARPGEIVDEDGLLDMGRTTTMYAVAEVYETDVWKVKKGQAVTITSDAFPDQLTGTVDRIGLRIGRKDVFDTDPAADVDSRVVEVKVRLNRKDSRKVAGLTNLRVRAAIHVDGRKPVNDTV